ncbi:MAG: DUF91 domain-containing protein [Cyanobacteria bacterium TGS_CYA1]|nr:DUF91 domain-containing protein [Cyanobacteria bacterium TGS_CYA1]
MSDLKLFRISTSAVREERVTSVALEKSLQTLIERHLDEILGIKFLASEFSTGKDHAGRIDTLGIDENGFPAIIEYKRSLNQNVINQGLFYLDWLLDHRGDFKTLVVDRYGNSVADKIDWSSPRLLCISGDFNKHDEYAVKQIDRNIQLIRYRKYGEELLLLELINQPSAPPLIFDSGTVVDKKSRVKTALEQLDSSPTEVKDLFESLRAFCVALGDDVQMNTLKFYFAFRRMKNFACVVPHQRFLSIFVPVDPETIVLREGFTRDVRQIDHLGTGKLEIRLETDRDLEEAKNLLLTAYENS